VADAQALAPDQVIERFAGHVLHGDVMNRLAVDLLGVDVVDGDDVRVIQRRSSLRFLNKPLFAVATDGGGAQNLDRAVRSRRESTALYTTPIPPAPSLDSMR